MVEFRKKVALKAPRGEDTVQAIAARNEVYPNQVSRWSVRQSKTLVECLRAAQRRRCATRTKGRSSNQPDVHGVGAGVGRAVLDGPPDPSN